MDEAFRKKVAAGESVFADYCVEVSEALESMVQQAEDKGIPAPLTVSAIFIGLIRLAKDAGMGVENVVSVIRAGME